VQTATIGESAMQTREHAQEKLESLFIERYNPALVLRGRFFYISATLSQITGSSTPSRPTLPGSSCSVPSNWTCQGLYGEGRPKEEEGEVGGETLRKRKMQRMLEDTGWGQGTCLYWSGRSCCWALAPAGRPSALTLPGIADFRNVADCGNAQGRPAGNPGPGLIRPGMFGLSTSLPRMRYWWGLQQATLTRDMCLCCLSGHALARFHQHLRILAMCAFPSCFNCQVMSGASKSTARRVVHVCMNSCAQDMQVEYALDINDARSRMPGMKHGADAGDTRGCECGKDAIEKLHAAIPDSAFVPGKLAIPVTTAPGGSPLSIAPPLLRAKAACIQSARSPSTQPAADISTLGQDTPPKVRENLAKVSSSYAAVAHKNVHWTVEDLSAPATEIPPHD
jgi:hypothetical protein